jgi:uncharacterized protein YegL
MSDRLGGVIAQKPMHFFFVVDASSSMQGAGKIDALNQAITDVVPHLQVAARANPHVQVMVRALAFATTTQWVNPEPVPVEDYRWEDLEVQPKGMTELGRALRELARQMEELSETNRGITPAIVLISDGQPTDTADPSFRRGLEELMAQPWGRKATRLAIGIGRDADLAVLQRFIGHPEIEPVQAQNPAELTNLIRWASTVAVQASDPDQRMEALPSPDPVAANAGPAIWDTSETM